jgi:hypothetical protein
MGESAVLPPMHPLVRAMTMLTDPVYRLRDIIHLGAGAQFSTTQHRP